ncbi:MAG: T9SS type A sorting domain-containing protein [Chitinophagales bacterium]
MKTFQTLICVLSFSILLNAQNLPDGFETFDGNNIETVFSSDGVFFWDLNNAYFRVPKTDSVHSIFTAGLWMGGIDAGGQLKVAAETYRQNGNDFWAGPLDENTGQTNATTIDNWSRIWKVNKRDIDQHIADYSDNNQVDFPQPAIYDWPGKGNPFAKGANNTPIAVTQDAAPFVDLNNNGVYEPDQGEYPNIKGDQMLWYVFNDNGGPHTETGGFPLQVENQISVYGYNCPDDDILYNTLFINYKIINRGSDLHDFYVGKWTDFDLGCFNNDLVSCDTASNTFYVYNGTVSDPDCASRGYGNDPPIQTISFLDQELSAHVFYNNDFSVTGNPENFSHYYNYITARWKDGTPFTLGGNAYGGTTPTSFMFPGNPSDPIRWSECSQNNTPADRRGMGVTGPFDLQAGDHVEMTLALSTHFLPFDTCPDFTPYRQRIDTISQKFANNQLQACDNLNFTCNDPQSLGCVWPGDASDDGIANVHDIFPIGIAYGTSDATRPNASTNWEGQPMQDWSQNFSIIGNNYKHADCNGDGIVDSFDLQSITNNYGLQHFKQSQTSLNAYPIASVLQPGPFIENTRVEIDIELGTSSQQVPDFYALAFTLNYNSDVVESGTVDVDLSDSWAGTENVDLISVHKEFPATGRVEVGLTRIDQINQSGFKKIATVSMILIDDIAGKENLLETLDPWISSAKAIKNDETEIELTIVSTEEVFFDSNIAVYPNPTNNMIFVELPKTNDIQLLRLYDNLGRVLLQRNDLSEGKTSINTSDLPGGIYYLEVSGEKSRSTQKISIIK